MFDPCAQAHANQTPCTTRTSAFSLRVVTETRRRTSDRGVCGCGGSLFSVQGVSGRDVPRLSSRLGGRLLHGVDTCDARGDVATDIVRLREGLATLLPATSAVHFTRRLLALPLLASACHPLATGGFYADTHAARTTHIALAVSYTGC